MQPGPKRLRVVCPLCNGPHALYTSATRQIWCPCAPGDGPLGPTPRGPLTSSTYIPSTPPNSMINSGGLLSGTDALDHRCCCGLLQAAAGCFWFRCWCCYFCLLFSRTRRVRTLPQLAWWDQVFIPPCLHYHFYTTTFSSSTKIFVPGPQQFYQCARAFYSYLLRGG